jgi:hypothetical protein
MDEFSRLIGDLKDNIQSNREFFRLTVQKNPFTVYSKLNELALFVGSRYSIVLEIHFPDHKKIYDINRYGTENMSIIIDKFRKTFPVARESIKDEANKRFGPYSIVVDAYMYEAKEGVRVKFRNKLGESARLEILPGSFHIWAKIDETTEEFCNWLMSNVYYKRIKN